MGRRTSSTKRTASAAMAVPGVIVYADGAATAAVCDADSSASATVALRPLGALQRPAGQDGRSGGHFRHFGQNGIGIGQETRTMQQDVTTCRNRSMPPLAKAAAQRFHPQIIRHQQTIKPDSLANHVLNHDF